MKAEIDLEWHMHIGQYMITIYQEGYPPWEYYQVKSENNYENGFKNLKDAIAWAKAQKEE